METILEQQRRYHEERERLQDSMVKEMMHVKKTVRAYVDNVNATNDDMVVLISYTVSKLAQIRSYVCWVIVMVLPNEQFAHSEVWGMSR